MKRTGPTKASTRKLIILLEKHGKKTKEKVWLDLAERLARPSRKRVAVNLWKIQKIAKKIPGKIYTVPGVVLGGGNLTEKIDVAAMKFSASAQQKIAEQKGHAYLLQELIEKNIKKSEILIVE